MNVETKIVSKNEKNFVRTSLASGIRVDGRRDVDCRPVRISFIDNGNCEVQMGQTRVVCVVSAKVVEPYKDRISDGTYFFEVILSPMASASFSNNVFSEESTEICRVVERALRESNAIDTESLCILSGSKVWAITVTMTVLDHSGNLIDACSAAALAALLHFRRPSVTVDREGNVKVHSWKDQEPAPLAIHHTPVSVTFGFLETEDGEVSVVDPSEEEELVLSGTMSVSMNGHGDICSIQKPGGCAIEVDTMLRCMSLAAIRSRELILQIEGEVKKSLQEAGTITKRNLISYLESELAEK